MSSVLGTSAHAQAAVEQAGYSLGEAIAAMREGHPLIAGARAQAEGARHDVTTAGLWTNPQLNATYTRSFGFTTFDPVIGFLQLGATQFIELAGVPDARRRAAESEYHAVEEDAVALERELSYGVWTAVVDLAIAIERRRIAADALAAFERGDQVVRARVAAGMAADYEGARIALAVADARSRVSLADAEIAAARGALSIAVGPRGDRLRGDPRYDVFTRPALGSLPQWVGAARSRPDLLAIQRRTMAARSRVDVARRSVVPGIAVYGGFAVGQGYGTQGERQVDAIVGVTVPLPIADRGQGSIAAAQSRAIQSERVADAGELRAIQEVRRAFEQVTQQRAALNNYLADTRVPADRLLAELEAAYREGHIAVYALVDGYEAVRDARLRALELAAGVARAEVELWRAAGQDPAANP